MSKEIDPNILRQNIKYLREFEYYPIKEFDEHESITPTTNKGHLTQGSKEHFFKKVKEKLQFLCQCYLCLSLNPLENEHDVLIRPSNIVGVRKVVFDFRLKLIHCLSKIFARIQRKCRVMFAFSFAQQLAQ